MNKKKLNGNGYFEQNITALLVDKDPVILAAKVNSSVCFWCKSATDSHIRCSSGLTRVYMLRNGGTPSYQRVQYPTYCACSCRNVAEEARETAIREAKLKLGRYRMEQSA